MNKFRTAAATLSKRALLAPLIVILILGGVSCQRGGEEELTTLDNIRNRGIIKVGYANEAPYAYYDSEAGKLTGEAPEIAREIAARLGVDKVEGVLTEFGSLIPGLKAKRFDIIAAGMYILPNRCKEIAFTNPTYKVGEAFLVKKGNPLGLHSYADVKDHPSARLGVVAGAVELSYAKATGVPSERISVLPDNASAVAAVGAGRIDAYAGTSLTINEIMNKVDTEVFEKADPFTDPIIDGKRAIGYGAFGIRKQDKELRESFNKHIKDFIGTPTHRELVEPFGFMESELPGDVTAEQLCKGLSGR